MKMSETRIYIERTYVEYWVEFDFNESRFGNRPDQIRTFKNRADADAFAETIDDAKVVEIEMSELIPA